MCIRDRSRSYYLKPCHISYLIVVFKLLERDGVSGREAKVTERKTIKIKRRERQGYQQNFQQLKSEREREKERKKTGCLVTA